MNENNLYLSKHVINLALVLFTCRNISRLNFFREGKYIFSGYIIISEGADFTFVTTVAERYPEYDSESTFRTWFAYPESDSG